MWRKTTVRPASNFTMIEIKNKKFQLLISRSRGKFDYFRNFTHNRNFSIILSRFYPSLIIFINI